MDDILIMKITTKDRVRKSAKRHVCGKFTYLTNYLSPQICGFVICESYLRTAHLW
jgi:hypothetical protein